MAVDFTSAHLPPPRAPLSLVHSALRACTTTAIGKAFSDHYYQTFDTNRSALQTIQGSNIFEYDMRWDQALGANFPTPFGAIGILNNVSFKI